MSLRVVQAIEGADCRLITASEAVATVRHDDEGCGALFCFATLAIWPLEEDLLIATDFEQTYSTEDLEPVMYLSEDSLALVSAAPRGKVDRVLDVACGSGVQGIVALRYYAEKVTFVDLNPRALRFTRLNLALNGFANKAEGVYLGSTYHALPPSVRAFDAIVSNPPFVPNPRGIASGASAMFGNGGETGEDVLKALIAGAHDMLVNGGRLASVSMAPNVEDMPTRIAMWYGEAAGRSGCDALIFRSQPTPMERYQPTANELETRHYQLALQALGITTLSETIVILTKHGNTVARPRANLVGDARLDLWSDHVFLKMVAQKSLDSSHTFAIEPNHRYAKQSHDRYSQKVAVPPPTPPPPPRSKKVVTKSTSPEHAMPGKRVPERISMSLRYFAFPTKRYVLLRFSAVL